MRSPRSSLSFRRHMRTVRNRNYKLWHGRPGAVLRLHKSGSRRRLGRPIRFKK